MHVDDNHQLVIDEAENISLQQIAAAQGNFDSLNVLSNPEFIVTHYTGGLQMQSTIHTFTTAPKDPSLGASAHLLVGRDGSVVQFLRFNQIAFHTGFSWWEKKKGLNDCSIGIEFDNVGALVGKNGEWHPRRQDQITIPDEEVQQIEYWKSPLPKGNRDDPDYASKLPAFQKFTEAQLAVALTILRALHQKYKPTLKDLLGHDQINIANRTDPGPLMPMRAWRQELFGREEPQIDEYIINAPTDMHANIDGQLPNTDQSTFGKPLPAGAIVKVITDPVGGLVKVNVIKSAVKGTGWIRSSSLRNEQNGSGSRIKTTFDQTFFRAGDRPPTLKVNQGFMDVNRGLVFQAGTRVRIQQFRDAWALVALLDRINGLGEVDTDHGQGGLEGWVRKEFVSPKAT